MLLHLHDIHDVVPSGCLPALRQDRETHSEPVFAHLGKDFTAVKLLYLRGLTGRNLIEYYSVNNV